MLGNCDACPELSTPGLVSQSPNYTESRGVCWYHCACCRAGLTTQVEGVFLAYTHGLNDTLAHSIMAAHKTHSHVHTRARRALVHAKPLPVCVLLLQEDPFNAIAAGALTGGFLQLRAGLRPAFRSAVFGGVLLVSQGQLLLRAGVEVP